MVAISAAGFLTSDTASLPGQAVSASAQFGSGGNDRLVTAGNKAGKDLVMNRSTTPGSCTPTRPTRSRR